MGDRAVMLVGGGGHASVVAAACRRAGIGIVGVLDDAETALGVECGRIGELGLLGWALDNTPGCGWVLALGDLGTRRGFLDARGARRTDAATTVIDPSAVVAPSCEAGRGVFVSARGVVQARARVGDHSIVNTGAIVEHDCAIGENVHVAPGAVLGGGVTVGDDTLIGLGARVRPGVTIGSGATVGMGAVVLADVGDGETVVGNPARVLVRAGG
ncbi:MAG: acetyltransferase [Phycisphaerales bacterium JB040]